MKLIYSTFIILIVITISITIIIISIITSIIAIIINSTKDDIWDMEELFHKLTNFENKVWCPVSKKEQSTHFLLSLAYPIDRLDWALFTVVTLFHHWLPLLNEFENRAFILPRNFPRFWSFLRGGAGSPSLPAGRGVHPWIIRYQIRCIRRYD